MQLFYLADQHDRVRLSTEGTIEAAHDCKPWYFATPKAAYDHPASREDGLLVHAVPAAKTVPGARAGTDIADAVMAEDVYRSVAAATVESIALLTLTDIESIAQ